MAKQVKAVVPSEHVPVILPIPDPDWAVEIKQFYPGEIDRERDLVPGRAPAFVSGQAGQKREISYNKDLN